MSTRITIPYINANVQDVTLVRWIRHTGDFVRKGAPVLELTTDKADFELEAPADGTLLATYAAERSVLPIGFIVGLLGTEGESDPAVPADNNAVDAAYRAAIGMVADSSPVPSPPPAPTSPAPRAAPAAGVPANSVRATPKARRLAREHNLDLAKIQAETKAPIITDAILEKYL